MNIKTMLRVPLAALAAGFLWGTAAAAATLYDESVQGDLSFAAPPTLTLSAGENTVLGSGFIYGSQSGYGDDIDGDPFRFAVPNGLQIETLTFAFTTQLLTGVQNSSVAFRLTDDNLQTITQTPVIDLFGASPVTVFGDVTPVPGGFYMWMEHQTGHHISTASTWDYTITFQVAPVPLPAALGLFAGALSLLGFARKRRVAVRQ